MVWILKSLLYLWRESCQEAHSGVSMGMMYEKGEGSQADYAQKLPDIMHSLENGLALGCRDWHDCTDKGRGVLRIPQAVNSMNKPAMKESLKVVDSWAKCLKSVKETKEIVYER